MAGKDVDPELQELLDKSVRVAVEDGNLDLLDSALNVGGSPDATVDVLLSTGLHIAAKQSNVVNIDYLAILDRLLEGGANPNARNRHGKTPLHSLMANEEYSIHALDIIRRLFARGADVNAREEDGTTPLMLAAYYGKYEEVDLLIELGADIHESRTDWQQTALFRAVRQEGQYGNQIKTVEALVDRGADLCVSDYQGRTLQSRVQPSFDLFRILQVTERSDSYINSLAGMDAERKLSFLLGEKGTPKKELWRLCSYGRLAEVMQESFWKDAPEQALKVWDAVGPYYQQKYHTIDRAYAYRAAGETHVADERSKAGWAGRRQSGQTNIGGRT